MEATDNMEVNEFSKKVSEKEKRKLNAMKKNRQSVWSGLGMFGIVGWSVVVPTLLGASAGLWLDKRYPQTFSWTLTGIISGLFCGCMVAWRWVSKEHWEITKD